MKSNELTIPDCSELNRIYLASERSSAPNEARPTKPRSLALNTFCLTKRFKRIFRKSFSSSLLLIASQSYQVLGQSTQFDPPKWRSRSETPTPARDLIADRNSGTRAYLGHPTADSKGSLTQALPLQDSSNHTSGYRDLPNSPWERNSASLDGVSNDLSRSNTAYQTGYPKSQMIRQPAASVGQVNRGTDTNALAPAPSSQMPNQSPSRGLPERNDLNPGWDAQRAGGPMTLDLSNYQKPSPALTVNGGRQGTQRLPFSGIPLSTSMDETSIGLGYPETVRNEEMSDNQFRPTEEQMIRQPVHFPARSQSSPHPFDAAPREAVRDLPVTTGAIRKATQVNERSHEREARGQNYTQLPPVSANLTGQRLRANAIDSVNSVFETEASSRSNVIGVINAGQLEKESPLESIGESDYPYSTDLTNRIKVVPASAGVHRDTLTLTQQGRMRTAGRISAELLDGSEAPLARTPLPVEPPAGWNSLRESLQGHLARCDDLLRRGAILSAREEVLMGMRSLARSIDLRSGSYGSEPAMEQALAAFVEESDFYRSSSSSASGLTTARIISGHKTNALKHTQLEQVSPDLAAQHYRSYARQQWLVAFQGHPWTSDLLYAYGKTLEREADQNALNSIMYRNQAIICYQAAMDVDPRHADNANQLGYALLQLDRVDEAQVALNQAVQLKPNQQAWSNLAEVHRRRGQADQVAYAQRKVMELNKTVPPDMVGVPEVIELDVKTFASVSPYPTGMQPPVNPGMSIQQPATVQQASGSVPVAKTSWFGNLFR